MDHSMERGPGKQLTNLWWCVDVQVALLGEEVGSVPFGRKSTLTNQQVCSNQEQHVRKTMHAKELKESLSVCVVSPL